MGEKLFLNNKYTKWYYEIINKSANMIGENHHIIPKSIGGTNDKENLIKLSFREHFICHWLLIKMTKGTNKSKMCFAFFCMSRKSRYHDRKLTSWQYELCKKYNKKEQNNLKTKTPNNKGKITVKDKNGKCFNVNIDDSRYISGELVQASKGLKRNWTKEQVDKKYASRRGRKQSKEHIEKRKSTFTGYKFKKVTCPKCNATGGESGMKKWHFNNCRIII